MKIAIDVSPLSSGHKVRGVGFYLQHLKQALAKLETRNEFIFFTHKKELEHIKPDVIHYPYFDPFFLTLPIVKNIKTIVTVHDLTPLVFPHAFPSGLKGKIRWQIQRLALKQVDHIIADSEASKKDIIRLVGVPASKVSVVYLAAGEQFKEITNTHDLAKIRRKYTLPKEFLLYVGDVTWNKNLPNLLDAVNKADVPLVMVGKALAEKEFDRSNPWNADRIIVEQKVRDNSSIQVLGFVPDEDIVALYNMATALILPSLYEGFGLPVIEAMQSGTAVITSDRGSLAEVGGDAVYYINPEDTESMAAGIKEVFTNTKLRESLQQKGLKRSKHFSWKKAGEETLRAYES